MAGSADRREEAEAGAGETGKRDVCQPDLVAESHEGHALGQFPKDQVRHQGKYYTVQSPARPRAQAEGGGRAAGPSSIPARVGGEPEAARGKAAVLHGY